MRRALVTALLVGCSTSAFAQSMPQLSVPVSINQIQSGFSAKIDTSMLGKANGPAQLGADGTLGTAVIGAGMTGAQMATAVSQAIPSSKINAASGVAGLDASGNVTASVLSPAVTGTQIASGMASPVVSVSHWPVVSNVSSSADPFQNPDQALFGNVGAGWSYNRGDGTLVQASGGGSAFFAGSMWGPYNAGCLICANAGTNQIEGQSGIAASDWRGGKPIAHDSAAEYIGVSNTAQPARLVLQASSYTNRSSTNGARVYLSTPLTSAQMAQLRVGMYIQTNSQDANVATTGSTSWIGTSAPPEHNYRGVISGWDTTGGTYIQVAGWGVGTDSNSTGDDTPSTTNLDTYFSGYTTPTVFIGAPINLSGRNEYLTIDGTNMGTSSARSLNYTMGGDELDLRYDGDKAGSLNVQGITISAAALGDGLGRNALASASYMLDLSGDMPNMLILDGPSDGNTILSHSFFVQGGQGTYYPTGTPSTATYARPVQTNWWFSSSADSSDALNLIGYQVGNGTSTGAANTSYHLGLHVNGTNSQPTTTGSNWGELEWNPKGAVGASIALCAASENCGVVVYGSGATGLPNATTVMGKGVASGNALTIGTQPSGHAAALGIYENTGDGNSAVEVMSGSTSLFTLDPSGNGNFAGEVKATSTAVTGNSYTGGTVQIALSSGGYATIYGDAANDLKFGTYAGGTQNITFGTGNAYALVAQEGVTASGYTETLTTPASSTSTCTAGQFTDDANYHYVCVATNTWKRAALSSF